MNWILCICAIFLIGCEQKPAERQFTEITVEAPADAPRDPHAGMDMGSMSLPGNGGADTNSKYVWVLPEGWKEVPGTGMRLASFRLAANEEDIDCSLISLAGAAGGLEANLKRWMGQIGLESSAADLTSLIAKATSIKVKGGLEGKVFDFTTIQPKAKPSEKSMVVVMMSVDEATLFVKMTGTVETVKKNKADFFKLAQSIEPKGESAGGIIDEPPTVAAVAKDPHAGMDMASMGEMMGMAKPSESMFAWVVPQGWKEEPAGHMRLATFHLASDPKLMDCSVISLGGPAGGIEANLERWIGQLGLEYSETAMAKLIKSAVTVKTKDGQEVKVYDFTLLQGNAKSSDKSMIAAMISVDNSTIFFKMTGSVEVVKNNKTAFLKLLGSITHK